MPRVHIHAPEREHGLASQGRSWRELEQELLGPLEIPGLDAPEAFLKDLVF